MSERVSTPTDAARAKRRAPGRPHAPASPGPGTRWVVNMASRAQAAGRMPEAVKGASVR